MTEKEPDYLFSKELRDLMEPFGDMTPEEALRTPAFFNALFDYCGLNEEEKKELWTNVGRPQGYDNGEDNI